MALSISIIIRSKNEEKTIEKTLLLIQQQTLQPKEILLVDNNSTDNTQKIARKYGCKVITINPKPFNHAYSCNVGASHAIGELLVFTNAHSYPMSNHWLADGIRHFKDPKVAGVFGLQFPDKSPTILRKVADALFASIFRKGTLKTHTSISLMAGGGILSTVNGIIRKDLWERHHFDESLSKGGEDTEWAFYFLKAGYKIIEDPKFSVTHYHKEDFIKVLKTQYMYTYMYFSVYKKYLV